MTTQAEKYDGPPREDEILESETSHIGHMQTTELAEQKPKPISIRSDNNFGPRGFIGASGSPQNMGRHAYKA